MKIIYNNLPSMIDLFIGVGSIIIVISAFISLYMLCSKKWKKIDAFKWVFLWAITEMIISLVGILIKFIYGFEPFGSQIPNVNGLLLMSFGMLLIGLGLLNTTKKPDAESGKNLSMEDE